jgi:hypothetical protein
MFDYIKDLALALILAGVCAIGAYLLRTKKQQILAVLADLIQKAEQTVRGSGLGGEKKAMVLAQLEAMGIKVTAWMSQAIDDIVKYLNERQAWFVEAAKDTLPE